MKSKMVSFANTLQKFPYNFLKIGSNTDIFFKIRRRYKGILKFNTIAEYATLQIKILRAHPPPYLPPNAHTVICFHIFSPRPTRFLHFPTTPPIFSPASFTIPSSDGPDRPTYPFSNSPHLVTFHTKSFQQPVFHHFPSHSLSLYYYNKHHSTAQTLTPR